MQLRVCGRRPRNSALWLRASLASCPANDGETASRRRDRVLLEAKVPAASSASSCVQVPFEDELLAKGALLHVELWVTQEAAADGSDAFLSLAGAACVDLKRWREATHCAAERWYPLQRTREVVSTAESAFEEVEERLRADTTYVRATLAQTAPKKKKRREEETAASETSCRKTAPGVADASGTSSAPGDGEGKFRFTLPSQLVTKNRRFLSSRVGEIMFEGNTAQLRELLPVALYGKVPSRSSSSSASETKEQLREAAQLGLDKSLQMLQLSCQYASYCTSKLEDNASAIEAAREKLVRRKTQLQAARRQMELRRRTLRRELQVLDSSLDGMQQLLQEVDPVSFARLLPGDGC